ncbi:helix-turn-helix transcriptional regulator [Nitrosomonas sp. Nm34]|uniref:helix-turn-helix transcriptional regulator n=1 Tax=Nitrosomonas sp. Nm34 TaxID=1881055 RepID=UPI0008EFD77A|nr:DNA-binding transcriptional regulator, XRE-family HTH domain [Nitrosomonas sp. Nm34]
MTPLRRLRIRKGLTLHQASEAIGIDYSGLLRIERGERWPRKETAKKIVEYFNNEISEEEIFWPEKYIN